MIGGRSETQLHISDVLHLEKTTVALVQPCFVWKEENKAVGCKRTVLGGKDQTSAFQTNAAAQLRHLNNKVKQFRSKMFIAKNKLL